MPTYLTPGQLRFGWGDIGNALPPIASVAGSIIDYASNKATNAANARAAQQAQDFQKEQSATQYQRTVEDLLKAGLNPGQFYSGRGGTDSAASGVVPERRPNTENTGEKLRQAMQAYQEFATSTAQRQLIREQTNVAQSQSGLNRSRFIIETPERNTAVQPDVIETYQQKRLAEQRADVFKATNEPTRFNKQLQEVDQRIRTNAAQERYMRTQATLGEQQFTNEFFRKNIAPYVNSTAATIRAFTPTFSLFPR